MRRLVANSLLYANLGSMPGGAEAGVVDPKVTPVAIASILESVIRQEATAATREADLQVQLEDATVRILPAHLSKIVEEIFNNALKYSTSGTPVEVTSRRAGDEVRITIKDYGRGMSSDEITAISAFRQFQRRQFEQQGLGLGLTITQRLLELYQGKMVIESVPGKFTTVQIILPVVSV
jgi:signal transduction histidine kinase